VDVGNLVLFGLFALVALNYVVPRTELARRHPAIFWSINGLDLVAGLAALLFGVPGFDAHPIVRFLIGLVVLTHLAQNFAVKARWDAEARQERLDAELRERAAFQDQDP
jgi:hypothetical protein